MFWLQEYSGMYPVDKLASFHITISDPTMFNGTVKDLPQGPKHSTVKGMRLYHKCGKIVSFPEL